MTTRIKEQHEDTWTLLERFNPHRKCLSPPTEPFENKYVQELPTASMLKLTMTWYPLGSNCSLVHFDLNPRSFRYVSTTHLFLHITQAGPSFDGQECLMCRI